MNKCTWSEFKYSPSFQTFTGLIQLFQTWKQICSSHSLLSLSEVRIHFRPIELSKGIFSQENDSNRADNALKKHKYLIFILITSVTFKRKLLIFLSSAFLVIMNLVFF
ncbi:hypothetical protein XENORESO_004103, partial [Xenotaenia resolanae]